MGLSFGFESILNESYILDSSASMTGAIPVIWYFLQAVTLSVLVGFGYLTGTPVATGGWSRENVSEIIRAVYGSESLFRTEFLHIAIQVEAILDYS